MLDGFVDNDVIKASDTAIGGATKRVCDFANQHSITKSHPDVSL
jgi:hypothetical protein